MNGFEILPYDFEQFKDRGRGTIEYKVDGFWSQSSIRVYVDVRDIAGGISAIETEINLSAGGRDDTTTDFIAYRNYANALNAACKLAEELDNVS